MKKGKLIVIEGIDGSGKTTQINLLSEYLKKKGVDFEIISFPQYGKNKYAKQITDYLSGKLGSIDKVDPYLVAKLFASDRLTAKQRITDWLNKGKLVIANRYVSASKAHLGANLSDPDLIGAEEKRAEFINWVEELEYQTNGMPKEDLTILLDINPKLGQRNVLDRHPDLHEENLKHLEQASKIYLELAKQKSSWYVTSCMTEGEMKSLEDIHQEIKQVLYDKI